MTYEEFHNNLKNKLSVPLLRPEIKDYGTLKILNPKDKFQIVIKNIGDIIEPIKEQSPKIWWQVYLKNSVFGFASVDGVIVNFPQRGLIGKSLKDSKWWFRGKNAEVVKICEQKLN